VKVKSKLGIFVGFTLSLLVIFYLFGLVLYKKTGTNLLSGFFLSNKKQNISKQIDGSVEGEVVQGIPDDFPVYQNSNLLNIWSVENESGAVSAVWESNDSVREVVDYYSNQLKKNGWEITSSIFTEESSIISFEKDGSNGFLGITEENNSTVISATIEFSK